MSLYVTDTHPLVWYVTNKHGNLSKKALRAFSSASRAEALIYVPAFVLWEIAMLVKARRITLRDGFGQWAERLVAQRGFELASLETQMVTVAYDYPFPDPFDGVIVATAKVLDLPLITHDWEISDSQFVETYW